MNESAPVVDYATPLTSTTRPRLLSLDVFRGLVILAMLVVNNIGDGARTGYFWKHADWVPMRWGEAWKMWWGYAIGPAPPWDLASEEKRGLDALNDHTGQILKALVEEKVTAASPWAYIPLFTHCTLADYVMPWFMLIIGVAIPFSVAASVAKGTTRGQMWLRALRRAVMLVVLGWVLCFFRDQLSLLRLSGTSWKSWRVLLGMDVLQLLGVSYLFAWMMSGFSARLRMAAAISLFASHWALMRFYPQGDVPRGTFNAYYNSIGYMYSAIGWETYLGPIIFNWRGLLSVIPATATMLLGTLIGDVLRRDDLDPRRKVSRLVKWSILMMVVGFLWAFDLPFNKPRWTPCYLLWCSGVGTLLLALLYWIIDVRNVRRWTYPLAVFGANAIALYWCSIMAKVLLLNTPRVGGKPLIDVILGGLKGVLGAWAGGWTFTLAFIGIWWLIMDQLYRRKNFIKV